MADNFQRAGSVNNASVGRDFEQAVHKVLAKAGIRVAMGFPVDVGVGDRRKSHEFDLGSESPPVLVECKSHRWTEGDNVPSAKLTVWNEAMFYFHCAPARYRKIFFVLRDERQGTKETLASYYIRQYGHLIPGGVEIWEYNAQSKSHEIVYGA